MLFILGLTYRAVSTSLRDKRIYQVTTPICKGCLVNESSTLRLRQYFVPKTSHNFWCATAKHSIASRQRQLSVSQTLAVKSVGKIGFCFRFVETVVEWTRNARQPTTFSRVAARLGRHAENTLTRCPLST